MTTIATTFTLTDFRVRLQHAGYVVTQPEAVATLWLALKDAGNRYIPAVLFDGPPGVGKTFLAEKVAEITGARLVFFQFFRGASREDLLFDLDIARVVRAMSGLEVPEGFGDMVSLGVLPTAAHLSQQQRVVLVLDELDKAHPSVDALLLDFLQSARLSLPHLGEIRANTKNLLVVITKNDERDLAEPLLRRVRPVLLSWPPVEVEVAMVQDGAGVPAGLAKSLVTMANRLREKNLSKVPSTPELIRLARDIRELAEEVDDAAELIGCIVHDTFFPFGQVPEGVKFVPKQVGGTLLARLRERDLR